MEELRDLAQIAGSQTLKGFPVVITHIKPGGNREAVIRSELNAGNPLNVKLIFPEQGKRLDF